MKYKTQEQWEKICLNALNGNWQDAGKNCIEFGFYAVDMINKYEEEKSHIIESTDIAYLAEIAAEIRYKQSNNKGN